jgi:uncharacterized cupin superfamily protein
MIEAINIFTAEKPDGRLDVAATAESSAAMYIYDIAPGRSSSPYHYEYAEEWLLVVDGTVTVRTPDGEHTLDHGALVRFQPGPEGAHKIMNKSNSPARTLLFSSSRIPAVSVYPDSNKIGVWPGDPADDSSFSAKAQFHGPTARKGWNQAD